MRMRFFALAGVVVLFGALSVIALLDVGYFGIIAPHFNAARDSIDVTHAGADLACTLRTAVGVWLRFRSPVS